MLHCWKTRCSVADEMCLLLAGECVARIYCKCSVASDTASSVVVEMI